MASRLQRFKDAQDQSVAGFSTALSEIRAGGKRSHWIWYVFPQLSGMGYSSASRTYGLDGVSEAAAYLRDPVLRSRLVTIATAVVEQLDGGMTLIDLMASSIDVTKLISSMTLFQHVANRLFEAEGLDEYESLTRAAAKILERAAAEGYPPCHFTLRALATQ